jgi:uncharacterized membrane protein
MSQSGKNAKKAPLWARLRHGLRRRLVAGLLVIVPLGITLLILQFLYEFTAGRLTPMVKDLFEPLPGFAVPVVSVAILFFSLYLVGFVATAVAGRQLIALAEALIQRIPLVKSVYGASKQIIETLSFQGRGADLKTAALVTFPHPGMRTVGFLTGKARLGGGRVYYKVFIPTTPNVTIGLFELVAPEDVFRCQLSVEDAVKMVVSGGILGPDRLKLTPSAQSIPEPAHAAEDEEENQE